MALMAGSGPAAHSYYGERSKDFPSLRACLIQKILERTL
jgi:hypothetical protein